MQPKDATVIEKPLCTGCSACLNICPVQAINMLPDEEGFRYPLVDSEKCTECGMCRETCPVINPTRRDNFKYCLVYAGWSRDEEIRLSSTSGGVFSEIAEHIVRLGGYVAGARYGDNHRIEHCLVDSSAGLVRIRQSKYAQSDIGLIYGDIKSLLDCGKSVLFCGTPCQNAGLFRFLGKDYERLVLCDFICRGVNSPTVYESYLRMLEGWYGSKIDFVKFKDKTYGWNNFSTLVRFTNGRRYLEDRYSDPYMIGYLRHNVYLRPSCYDCKFKMVPHLADITLGDFWGIAKTRPHLDEDKGTSVIMINSDKGRKVFEGIKPGIRWEACTLREVSDGNPCLAKSVARSERRDEFFAELRNRGFEAAMTKLEGRQNLPGRLKWAVKEMRRWLKDASEKGLRISLRRT